MFIKLKEIRALNAFAKKQSVGMQRKLMLYWVSMILVVFATIIFLLSIAGTFSQDDKQLNEIMKLYLENTQEHLENHLEILTAKSLNLSKELSRDIEIELAKEGVAFQDINNNQKLLLQLQEAMYPLISSTLQTANCNGSFIMLNATTNTEIDSAEYSRSGIYLRYSNLCVSSPVSPTVVYFRGIPDIALQKNLELHNRWNLEFDTSALPGYEQIMQFDGNRLVESCLWTDRLELSDTWEDVQLLYVPVLDSTGKVRGLCGMEMSNLYFRCLILYNHAC